MGPGRFERHPDLHPRSEQKKIKKDPKHPQSCLWGPKTESEVSKRGWRTEGVGARKSFMCQRFRPLFCTLFLCPLGEGGHISGELFGLFLGVCLSPTPSRQPLFETSDWTQTLFSQTFRGAPGIFGCSATVGITTVQIEILGAKFQILGPRCAPHYFSGPSSTTLGITTLQCKSKFWARNFKFWAWDVHPTISQAQVKTCWARKTNSRSTHPRSNEIPEISQQNPGMSRPKKIWFPWFRGTYRTFWPPRWAPPLHAEDPHPTR